MPGGTLLRLAVGVLGVLAAVGCAPAPVVAPAPPVPAVPAAAAAPAAPASERGYNVADIVFLQRMLAHHQVAAQMAETAMERAQAPAVQELARTVLAECNVEAGQMDLVLRSLSVPVSDPGEHAHGEGPAEADVAALATRTGADFDRSFVDLLGRHLTGAVELAHAEAREGSNTALTQFAARVAARESGRMTELPRLVTP